MMKRLMIGIVAAAALAASAAWAIQPGTTGTEKRYQQQGLRSAVLLQPNLTASATAGAATLNAAGSGVITSEALSTAAGAVYTLTLTNSMIAAGDVVLTSVQNGTSTAGMPAITTTATAANTAVVKVQNIHAADALNGTIKISFLVVKQNANGSD